MLLFRSFLSAHMTARSCSACRRTTIHASVSTGVKVAATAVKRRSVVASIGVRTTSVIASCVRRFVGNSIAFILGSTASAVVFTITATTTSIAVAGSSAVVTSVARRGVAVVVGALVIGF